MSHEFRAVIGDTIVPHGPSSALVSQLRPIVPVEAYAGRLSRPGRLSRTLANIGIDASYNGAVSNGLKLAAGLLLLTPAWAGDAAKGKDLFVTCAGCHNIDSDRRKSAPSLRSLFGKVTLRNGKRATEENVRAIVLDGYNSMPSFRYNLTAEQAGDLMAFLLTLKGKPEETAATPEAAAFKSYCASCHAPELRGERGPDLRGLFKREKLASGEPVAEKAVRGLIDGGHAQAPPFEEWLDAATRQKIVEFLKAY